MGYAGETYRDVYILREWEKGAAWQFIFDSLGCAFVQS